MGTFLLARAPFTPLMACCFLNKDADLTHFPTFVTPSAGETDACGKHCGPISYAFPTTQIVCCARDPYVSDEDDAYDADGTKRMPARCGVFMILCLPLLALIGRAHNVRVRESKVVQKLSREVVFSGEIEIENAKCK